MTTFTQQRRACFTRWERALQRSILSLLVSCAVPLAGQQMAPVVPAITPVSIPAVADASVPRYTRPYLIGPGDSLTITYPYNAELNHIGPVGPDGRISLPFIGTLTVGGKTTDQVSEEISRDLFVDGIAAHAYPNVQITIYGYAHDVYVGGQVGKPGMITLSTDMDPLQAVMAAGGFLDTARSGRVAVIHRTPDNQARVTYIDVHDYLQGKPGTHTVQLAPYDVVYVPKSKISEIDQWIDDYINKTIPFTRSLNYSAGNYGTNVVAGK